VLDELLHPHIDALRPDKPTNRQWIWIQMFYILVSRDNCGYRGYLPTEHNPQMW
jgi:hypothetical protein